MFVGIEYLNEIGALPQDDMNTICKIDPIELNNDQGLYFNAFKFLYNRSIKLYYWFYVFLILDTSESEPMDANQNQPVEDSVENGKKYWNKCINIIILM